MVTTHIPYTFYTTAQVRELDRMAIDRLGGSGYALMKRAASAILDVIRLRFSKAKYLLFVAGSGKNGGDAFLAACLAKQAGYAVCVYCVKNTDSLRGDVAQAFEEMRAQGVRCRPIAEWTSEDKADLILDGVLGTGVKGELKPLYQDIIEKMNRHSAEILAIDLPSGLIVDSGSRNQAVINATATITFIGVKRGLLTGTGPECAGQVWFDDLGVEKAVYEQLDFGRFGKPVEGIQPMALLNRLRKRNPTDHKGKFGHLLLVGGNSGMLGAIMMAGLVGLRSGAGLVTVATRAFHAPVVSAYKPELMSHGVESAEDLDRFLQRATAVVVGPGLGVDAWAKEVLETVLKSNKPLVMDADALNLLAIERFNSDADALSAWRGSSTPSRHGALRSEKVITPHPGEAARLLNVQVSDIQADRFKSVVQLANLYEAVAVLKGAGTLIANGDKKQLAIEGQGVESSDVEANEIRLNQTGNPGMATGGMGDILSGLIGALLAQGIKAFDAAVLAVMVHGYAADCVVEERGEVGLLATDLVEPIRNILNGQVEV